MKKFDTKIKLLSIEYNIEEKSSNDSKLSFDDFNNYNILFNNTEELLEYVADEFGFSDNKIFNNYEFSLYDDDLTINKEVLYCLSDNNEWYLDDVKNKTSDDILCDLHIILNIVIIKKPSVLDMRQIGFKFTSKRS